MPDPMTPERLAWHRLHGVNQPQETINELIAEVERLREENYLGKQSTLREIERYERELKAAEAVVEFVAECHTGCGAAIGCPTCKLIDAYRAVKET